MTTTPIGLSSQEVLRYCRAFCELQQGLLAKWREENSEAKDMDMFLDFKKEATIKLDGVDWSSRKHGVGVRFESRTGTCIDVPYGIDHPNKIDPDRVYDYLVSIDAFSSPNAGKPPRSAMYFTFDYFEQKGFLIVSTDSKGRKLYNLAVESR